MVQSPVATRVEFVVPDLGGCFFCHSECVCVCCSTAPSCPGVPPLPDYTEHMISVKIIEFDVFKLRASNILLP
jgi:hypothetical protein